MYFSIVIPTYGYNGRGAEFLAHNLKKIKEQLFTDYEVVISDHSEDDTIKTVVDNWGGSAPLTYVRCDFGRGMISPNLNNGLRHCRGEWIKVLFQDDFLYNEYALLCQSFHIGQCAEKWYMTRFVHSNDGESFYRDMTPVWNDQIYLGNNTLGCPSGLTMLNQRDLNFDESLNWLVDCDFYMYMEERFGLPGIIPYITTVNRTWGKRLTDTIPNDIRERELLIMKQRYGVAL